MIIKLLRFNALKLEAKIKIIQIIFWLYFFNILKYFCSISTLLSFVKSSHRKVQCNKNDILEINNYFIKIYKYLFNPTCLVKSLALKKILVNKGYQSSLKIGVKKSNNEFESHAWVEVDQINFKSSEDINYKIIQEIS